MPACKALGGSSAAIGHALALREGRGQRGTGGPEPHPGHQHLSGPKRVSLLMTRGFAPPDLGQWAGVL